MHGIVGSSAYLLAVGAWGTGIFDDDVALDVRGAWEDARAEGLSPEAAAAQIVESLSEYVEDVDDGPILWLALASLQLEVGALDRAVAERARSSINPNLERWRDEASPDDFTARQVELTQLGQRLTS